MCLWRSYWCVFIEVVLVCVCRDGLVCVFRGRIVVCLWRSYCCVFVEVVLLCVCGGRIVVC